MPVNREESCKLLAIISVAPKEITEGEGATGADQPYGFYHV